MDKPSPVEPVSEQQQAEAETASKLETIQALFRDFDKKVNRHEEIPTEFYEKLMGAVTRESLHSAGVDDQSPEVALLEKENAFLTGEDDPITFEQATSNLREISKIVRNLHTSDVSGLNAPDDADAQKVAQKQDPQDVQPAQAQPRQLCHARPCG